MKKLLIVDDDVTTTRIYQSMFEEAGFEVECALDGETAIATLKQKRPDAVLLDLILPKIHGIEVLRFIRGEANLKTIPVIVFSNAYLASMIKAAWQAGASMSLTKANCTAEKLVEALRMALSRAETNAAGPAAQISEPAPSPSVPWPTRRRAPEPEPAASAPATTPSPAPSHAAAPAPAPPTPAQEPARAPAAAPEPGAKPLASQTLFAQIRQNFLADAPKIAFALGTWTPMKGARDVNWPSLIYEVHKIIQALPGQAGIAGFAPVAQLSSALKALLKDLLEEPEYINASTFRTVTQSAEALALLLLRPEDTYAQSMSPANILVVDDEVISRRTVCSALELANFKPISIDDSNLALKLTDENQFDLIILDVNMPGLDGFQLCSKIRATRPNKKTPVVFATSMNDFESRAKSTMSGGNDLIAKPFLLIELAVKALTYVLKAPLKTDD